MCNQSYMNKDMELEIQYIPHDDNEFLSQKTIFIFRPKDDTWIESYIWIVKLSNYKIISDLLFPSSFDITFCKQIKDMDTQNIRYNHNISDDIIWDIDDGSEDAIENYYIKYNLNIKSAVFNILDKSSFWKNAPDGYSYNDVRGKYKNLRSRKRTLSDKEKQIISGVGPHIFEK